MNEGLQTKAENDRRPPADAFAPQPPSPREEQNGSQRRRDPRRKPRGEIVFAEKTIARHLHPINPRRFVEAVLIIEVRDNIIAPLAHLARGLGKARLIAIDQRDQPGTGRVQDQAGKED